MYKTHQDILNNDVVDNILSDAHKQWDMTNIMFSSSLAINWMETANLVNNEKIENSWAALLDFILIQDFQIGTIDHIDCIDAHISALDLTKTVEKFDK